MFGIHVTMCLFRVLQPQFLGALVQFFSRYALQEEEKAENITVNAK